MTRVLGIAAAFVVALALAPISAQGQQIFACVNNSSRAVKIVAPNATCRNNETLLFWGSGGALAGADYQCVNGQAIPQFNPLIFLPSLSGVSFGSSISTTGSQFDSFVLQPGIYQIHLSGTRFQTLFPNQFF
jgi:hypothetical protein